MPLPKRMSKIELEKYFYLLNSEIYRRGYITKAKRKLQDKKIIPKTSKNNIYFDVFVNGRKIKYHNLLWILINGDIPENFLIDHIDGNKNNNNIENLRLVTHQENCQNKLIHREGKLPGVWFDKRRKMFISTIRIKNKSINLASSKLEEPFLYEIYKLASDNKHLFENRQQFKSLIKKLYYGKYE